MIHTRQLLELARVFDIGDKKHGDNDWYINPLPQGDHIAALYRHLTAYKSGQSWDPDGQHHLASVAWRALVVMLDDIHGSSIFTRRVEPPHDPAD